jgi:hypothetical protein
MPKIGAPSKDNPERPSSAGNPVRRAWRKLPTTVRYTANRLLGRVPPTNRIRSPDEEQTLAEAYLASTRFIDVEQGVARRPFSMAGTRNP